MPQPIVGFTDKETQLLRDLRIAIFRNKIILDAQLPITDAQLAEVEKKIDGKVSPELLALWKTSFGGTVDYDYEMGAFPFCRRSTAAIFREQSAL